jgi:site-specific DNA recombinase
LTSVTAVGTLPIAASYERVSTRLQGQAGFSLGAQDKDAVIFAREHGLDLRDDLRFRDGEDRAASGADWDLDGLNAVLDAAKRRLYQVLIVPDPDRFARNMVKALVLEEQLRKHGVRVLYIRMPLEDTAEGRLLKHQLFSIAEYEREKITFRTARGRREKAERGLVIGAGPAPFGYRYVRGGERQRIMGLEPDSLTAPIVQRIFREALSRPTRAIIEGLRADKSATPRAPWSTAAVFRILTNPAYAGRFVYGGRGRSRARQAFADGDAAITSVSVPPLVDRTTWDRVQQALAERRRRPGPRPDATADDFVLRGLLTCGECGGGLSASWNNGARGHMTTRYYQCIRNEPHRARILGKPVCSMRALRAEHLEALIWDVVAGTLLNPDQLRRGLAAARSEHDSAAARRADRQAAIERELERHRRRIRRVVEELLDTDKGSETYTVLVERRDALESTVTRLQAEFAEQNVVPVGLSPAEAAAIEQFAAEADIRAGAADVGAATLRAIYERLRLRGTIRMAEDGVQIGTKHRFDIDLEAVISLSDEFARLKNKLTIYPIVDRFLRLHLLGAAAAD